MKPQQKIILCLICIGTLMHLIWWIPILILKYCNIATLTTCGIWASSLFVGAEIAGVLIVFSGALISVLNDKQKEEEHGQTESEND